ncbi:hypothetical protein CLU83_3206 [Flavobacterium sp. 1]|uniref:hypothetical protein n=1 Tax=Flavobacterium sp. 1 TaxID=2035200 RepID=UPI000C246412|nr:hypothetical protein [Flavobacterium sp. 1]PJJ09828.1 hypothetical protein CLU83_3206 [Flavobacterium sp. 1]
MSDLTTEDLNEFPDFEIYFNGLKTLDDYDFSNLSNREIYDTFYDYAKILPYSYGIFNPQKFNQHIFFRVRLNIDREKEDISLIHTYSYPPSSVCKDKGRANLNGKSVFYCSNNPNAAILECKPKIGDEGYLSFWNGNASRPVKAGICLPYDLPDENEWNIIAKDSFEYLIKSLPYQSKDKFKHFMALYKFISHKFISEKNPYPLTSMLSNEMLYGDLHRDFIIYPSVLTDTKLCNMAFHPNSVIENLKFEKVLKFKVSDIKDGVIQFNLGKVGFIQNGRIKWRNYLDEETIFFRKETNNPV